ncbi:C2H2-like zinc finger protein [Rhynchospora pubera]|uniref:C2H2-like zinc finger protein n=1 Tax=Rhynchospora pubera TaxID=906938 RepID=A0AAV8GKX0_9POAL|nr:C2H2-like zinc finger protein [Rhynchospora pubera]
MLKKKHIYKCKTCNRQFPTFQALGGHRTSHERIRFPKVQVKPTHKLGSKPKVHVCPICGVVFPMGQALGGHMRRHKPDRSVKRKPTWFNLNSISLPDEDGLELRLGPNFSSHEIKFIDFFNLSS